MLERGTLLLRPWAAQRAARVREVVEADGGRLLGRAYCQQPEADWWQRLLRPEALAVHEGEDEPLLFTVERPWRLAPRWQVRDADAHRVAALRSGWVLDRYSQPLAHLERAGSAGWALRMRGGRELARLARADDGVLFHFAPDVQGEPFVKMALLAAALVWK
jgi:hypothetical protein